MQHHVWSVNALRWLGIVRAARSMDVMIAREPSAQRWIDPALHIEVKLVDCWTDIYCAQQWQHLWAARELYGIPPWWQAQGVAIAAVDLRVKTEVGSGSLRLGGVDAPKLIADLERTSARLIVLVEHTQYNVVRRDALKDDVDLVAKPEVLCSLTNVKQKLRLARSSVTGVQLHDPILDSQPRESLCHWLGLEQCQLEPAVAELVFWRVERGRCVRAFGPEPGGRARLVVDFEEEHRPTGFDQLRFGGPRLHLDAAVCIDGDSGQAVGIDRLLDGRNGG